MVTELLPAGNDHERMPDKRVRIAAYDAAIGQAVRELRSLFRLSMEDLAAEVGEEGWDRHRIWRIERDRGPTLVELDLVDAAFQRIASRAGHSYRQGEIYVRAGKVDTAAFGVADAISTDPELTPMAARVLEASYRAAVELSRVQRAQARPQP